ncbi:MAG: hypothetical protein IJB34_08295 [Clostridia bacterium]|nr:hypothetical protein [Clostridia bacterium]
MAAPIIPILKKVAVAVLTDKKLFKKVMGIILGIIIIILTPVLAIVGIFSQLANVDMSEAKQFIAEYETTASMICEKIEQEMTGLGYTSLQIEEAQTLYVFALYDYGEEEGFVEKIVSCYTIEEQTDEELIAKVNETFGTEYTVDEYTDLMQEIRDNHVLDENENQEENIA